MTVWNNEDGLTVKFGNARSEVKESGVTAAEEKVLTFKLEDAVSIPDTDGVATDGHDAFIPAGAHIKDAVLLVSDAFASGGAATLNVGTKDALGADIDGDGFFAAEALGGLTADTSLVSAGALIGTTVTSDSYVTFTWDAAAYTAGSAVLVVKFVDARVL